MTEYLFVHYLIQGIQLPSKEMLPSETETQNMGLSSKYL